MSLPDLTHLQFLVVAHLLRGAARGRDLRAAMKQDSVRQSGPAFYQMMAALEDAGFVAGRYEQQIVDGQILRERYYSVSARGKSAWQRSRDFYLRVSAAVTPGFSLGPS